jgi:hypothetical protein
MGRILGNASSEGLNASVRGPIDDRQKVAFLSDLVRSETWNLQFYKGMITVVVEDENDASKDREALGLPVANADNNGAYIYLGALGSAAVREFANWQKIGSGGGSSISIEETEDGEPILKDKDEELLTLKSTDEIKVKIKDKKVTFEIGKIDEGFWK